MPLLRPRKESLIGTRSLIDIFEPFTNISRKPRQIFRPGTQPQKIMKAARGLGEAITEKIEPTLSSMLEKSQKIAFFSPGEKFIEKPLIKRGVPAIPAFLTGLGAEMLIPGPGEAKHLSTRLLNKFKGLPKKIKTGLFESVINKAKKEGIKEADERLVRESVVIENGIVDLPKTTARVEEQLVPLTPTPVKAVHHEWIGHDFIGSGKYGEIVYQSPVKTSVGEVHFPVGRAGPRQEFPNYFSHIRYEDMTDGKTRKILETQSDLFQKGRFEREMTTFTSRRGSQLPEKVVVDGKEAELITGRNVGDIIGERPSNVKVKMPDGTRKWISYDKLIRQNPDLFTDVLKKQELSQLQPYATGNYLPQLRTFREEVKRAAKDGKDTLLIPNGRTAMKIEGLEETPQRWYSSRMLLKRQIEEGVPLNLRKGLLTESDLRVGMEITAFADANYIITDVLGEGRFKIVMKRRYDQVIDLAERSNWDKEQFNNYLSRYAETFDISGKADTKHFVYKLNENAIPKEAKRLGLKVEGPISLDNGEWWEIAIPKEKAKAPIEAFGVAPFLFPRQEEE